jgi:uncharacterized protein YlaI
MVETRPIQIFLCHASEHKVAVLEIYERLKIGGGTTIPITQKMGERI